MEQKEFPSSSELTPTVKAFLKFLSEQPKPSPERRRQWSEVLDPLRECVQSGKISLEEYGDIMLEALAYYEANSKTDSLTKLFNRNAFDEFFPKEILKAERHNYPLSLLILDVNKLKEWNDEDETHESGDKALINTADAIKKKVRVGDIPGRYGGDEFYVILPQADEEIAIKVAKRITKEIERVPLISGKKLSVSIGISQWRGESPNDFFRKADKAAYKAKREKRSFVVAKDKEG
jgi:diguanylate cyclase (GGDEF)-like protein